MEFNSHEQVVYIYDSNLNLLGIIDTYISLRWKRCYFGAGDFELVVSASEEYSKLLKPNRMLLRNNVFEGGIIENIELNDDGTQVELSVSGRMLSSILSRRIVKQCFNFSGDYTQAMRNIQGSAYMTPIVSNYVITSTSLIGGNIKFQSTYKNTYDVLVKLSKASNIAFRVVADVINKNFRFEFYKGLDRSTSQNTNEPYTFNKENVEKNSYTYSIKNYYSYALVGGSGEGADRIMQSLTASDRKNYLDRWETFVDAKSETKEDDETDAQYKESLKQLALETLSNINPEKIDFTAYNDDYKVLWDLGDIVGVYLSARDITNNYRIIEVEEVIEDGKFTIYPTFGNIEAEEFEEES